MSSSRHTLRPAHAPQVAYRDPVFLESKAARPLRILGEYLHPLVQLRQEGIGDTIVMFGSARIGSREAAAARLARLKQARTGRFSGGRQKQHRAALREARSALEMSRYYEEARELSRRITAWAMTLGEHPRRFGGKSVGLSIELPHEQFANPHISPELSFNFHYFFMRKLWFAQLSKALIVFPGGFGTMDELWEMLTLLQTGKLPKHNLILIYGRRYWDEVLNWRAMLRWGVIDDEEYGLLQFADTVDQAFERVRSRLEKYHMKLDTDLEE